jgi:hypothetical protein
MEGSDAVPVVREHCVAVVGEDSVPSKELGFGDGAQPWSEIRSKHSGRPWLDSV